MKRRLIALLIIVVMLTALVFTCISCSTGIFSKDEERDYYQVIATVTYGDLSKDIYKGQLATYVNSYGSQYQSNYNMTIDEIVEYFYNTLTRSALLTLYAKYYVYEKAAAGDADYAYIDASKAITALSDKDFVTLQQLVYSIDQTNDEFMSSFESILSGLNTDDEIEEYIDTSDELEARTVRTYSDDDATSYDDNLKCTAVAAVYGIQYENLTYGEITEDFIKTTLGVSSVDEFISSIDIYGVINAKIKAETDTTVKKNMKSALKTLKENISKSYTDYDWFLTDNLNSCVITTLRDGLKSEETSTTEEIDERYTALIIDNLANYDETSYASAISGSTFLPVNASQDYTGVKSILLKFSDEQSAALTAINANFAASEDKIVELREAIALGYTSDATIDAILANYGMDSSANEGVLVNISNPYYDADTDTLSAAYTDKDVNYKVVLYCMADSIKAISDEIVTLYKASDEYTSMTDATEQAIALAIVEYSAKVEAFTQWMYLVNDDPGMFSSETYTVTPSGTDTSYVEQYTVLARKLATQDIASYTSGTYSAGTLLIDENVARAETGSEYNIDNQVKIYVEKNVESQTKSDTIKANVYTLETEAGNTISFCINSYGIQIIMLAEKYGQPNFVANSVVKINENGEEDTAGEGYAYTKDAIYSRDTTIKYDYVYSLV